MIWRRTIPKDGATRTVTKRAWLPKRMSYGGEVIWVWLDEYVDKLVWCYYGSSTNPGCIHRKGKSSWHWCRRSRMVLSDALLEKLNPPAPPAAPAPAAQPTGYSSQLSTLMQPGLQSLWTQAQQSYQQRIYQQQLAALAAAQQQGKSP